jgi:hypothetical protein
LDTTTERREMTAMPIDGGRPFTVHDLEGMPDDRRRYELIDGELFVSPRHRGGRIKVRS